MKKENAIKRMEKVTLNRATKGYRLVMSALKNGYKFIRPCRTSGRGLMKKARILNGVFWSFIGVLLIEPVCYEWHTMGCCWWSLLGAFWFYGTMSVGFGVFIDKWIKERYE